MERLTGRTKNGTAFAKPTHEDSELGLRVLYGKGSNGTWTYSHIIERLTEYEDAEEDGRLIMLPMAPDAIYWTIINGVLAVSRFDGFSIT